jgi:hypothetical protein
MAAGGLTSIAGYVYLKTGQAPEDVLKELLTLDPFRKSLRIEAVRMMMERELNLSAVAAFGGVKS